jgi:hypothetical protein
MYIVKLCLPLAGIVLAGCATTPSPVQRTYFDQQATTIKQAQASLVSDSCVVRDEVGDDYVLRQASRDVGIAGSTAAVNYLTSQGYHVTPAVTPFICGTALLTGGKTTVKVAENADTPSIETTIPIALLDSVRDNPALADAYRQLLQKVSAAISADDKKSPSLQGKTTPLQLTQEQLAVLKQELGNSYVWVVSTGGLQVSGGKSIGVGILTGIVSLALSGGTMVSTSMPIDGNGYDLALLNLETNEIIWKKHLQAQSGDPADSKLYNATWAKSLFEPFLSTTTMAAASTAPVLANDSNHHEPAEQNVETPQAIADQNTGSAASDGGTAH